MSEKINRDKVTGRYIKKHGMKDTKLYGVWCAMKERCYNKNHKSYKHYGAKGICVCDEWLDDFLCFYNWSMDNGYGIGLTIDRIDCNSNYCTENCRWVSNYEQNRNYSKNKFLKFNGEILCLSDMANKYGINRCTLALRLKNGKPLEEALRKVDGRSLRWKK